ncbi:MAG: glycosyltransferase [Firmicutes bacterium]|nr:glycosyltransferase [Bacillota bacterium]
MKKILIFYASFGGGHLSAARNIKEYIDTNYGSETETQFVDGMEYVNKALNTVTKKAYSEMAKSAPWAWKQLYNKTEEGPLSKITHTANKVMSIKLNKLVQEFKPDLIISTDPWSSQMCSIVKKQGKINCRLATVLTDYEPHAQWLANHEQTDYFFVAHDGMKPLLLKYGAPESKIFVTGIPLSNRFLMNYDKEKVLSEFGLALNKTTILFFAGGEYGFGKDKTYNILKSLISHFPDMQVIAIAGRNVKMKEQFENLVSETRSYKTVKVLEYTNKVPELMSVSDLVITKPGGLTTTESIASGLPIIVINPIPGQEEANAQFVEDRNIGIWIREKDNVEERLRSILNSPEKIKEMKINARIIAKKNSTKDICEILLNPPL